MAKENIRKAKLHTKYHPATKPWRTDREVPWLNLSGRWLEEAGFRAGDAVDIRVEENMLIIKNRGYGDQGY